MYTYILSLVLKNFLFTNSSEKGIQCLSYISPYLKSQSVNCIT